MKNENIRDIATWTVWVGGTEVIDNYVTADVAQKLVEDYSKMGYLDVKAENTAEFEVENIRAKELIDGDWVVWDTLDGAEHIVYLEETSSGSLRELYRGSNYDHAEEEYEDALKYFGGKDD